MELRKEFPGWGTIRKEGRVLFCPFCGSGTLLMGKNPVIWECMKCKRKFAVAVDAES